MDENQLFANGSVLSAWYVVLSRYSRVVLVFAPCLFTSLVTCFCCISLCASSNFPHRSFSRLASMLCPAGEGHMEANTSARGLFTSELALSSLFFPHTPSIAICELHSIRNTNCK